MCMCACSMGYVNISILRRNNWHSHTHTNISIDIMNKDSAIGLATIVALLRVRSSMPFGTSNSRNANKHSKNYPQAKGHIWWTNWIALFALAIISDFRLIPWTMLGIPVFRLGTVPFVRPIVDFIEFIWWKMAIWQNMGACAYVCVRVKCQTEETTNKSAIENL